MRPGRPCVFLLCVTLASTVAPVRAQTETAPGWMTPPVDGAIGRPYDPPPGPFGAGHRGIDYAVSPGGLVRAAEAGRVTFAGPVAGVRAVSIDHGDGLTTTYSSLSSTFVGTTETVHQGQWLGRAGVAHDGGAAGLHFGVKLNGEYVDPSAYLGPVGLAGAIHLAPTVWHPPETLTEGFRSAFDAGAHRTTCTPVPDIGDPPPPNRNIAVAIAGIDSQTSSGDMPNIYEHGPELLGYPRAGIYHFSYDGARGPSLHEPYDKTATYRDLRESAKRLRGLLSRIGRRAPGRRVDLIAHSQGGLIARRYLESLHRSWDPRLPVIDHVVTFSTPHEGAPLAGAAEGLLSRSVTGGALLRWLSRRARSGSPWPDPLSEAVAQVAPGSALLEGLGREDIAFGTRALALGIANDVVVPADRARWDDELSRVMGPSGLSGHTAITGAGDALATAYAFLRDGRRPCTTGWDVWGPRAGAVIGWVEQRVPDLYSRLEGALLRRALLRKLPWPRRKS